MHTTTQPLTRAVLDALDGRAHSAKCPKCGKMASRSLAPTRRGQSPRCWIFHHDSIPGFAPGVRQAVQCFVTCHPDGSYAI